MQAVFCNTKPAWQGRRFDTACLRSPVASLSPMMWLREQRPVPTFTTPSKRIAVLSLAELGDLPLHQHRTMHNRLAD